MASIYIINGIQLAKGFGVIGGCITASKTLCDAIRSEIRPRFYLYDVTDTSLLLPVPWRLSFT